MKIAFRLTAFCLVISGTMLMAQQAAKQAAKQKQAEQSEVQEMQKFLAIGKPPDPAAVDRGKQKFIATCGFCHGANANGGEGGPDLIRSTLVLHDENGNMIGPVVLHGRADKGMPAFPAMTPAQISDIAAFLKSRYQLAANRASYQIRNIVTGDAKQGEAYFNGAGGCAGCHSPTGDLAGIASRLTPEQLQADFLYPRPQDRHPDSPAAMRARQTAVVTLADGQKFSGVVNKLDDFGITLTDSAGTRHTVALGNDDGTTIEVHDPLAEHAALLRKYSNADMHNLLAYLETLK